MLQAVKHFREGKYNVLVATCIAEEGLDIGGVDLVVNFDTVTSAVRMVQRAGRTGYVESMLHAGALLPVNLALAVGDV